MTEDHLHSAVERLRRFREHLSGAKCDGLGLTTRDLDVVLARLDEVDGVVLVHDPNYSPPGALRAA